MWKTVVRRCLIMIPQLFVLSLLIFILAKLMPGDPFSGLITPETDPARIAELREQAGLNDPWYIQYVNWINNIFHGDFGDSYTFKVSVASLLGDRGMNTLWSVSYTHLTLPTMAVV